MRHYLDHASTSPLRPAARDALLEVLDGAGGDPGRIHAEGMAARVALEGAHEQVAGLVGCRSREVVFTSGASESVAAATFGALARHGPGGRVVLAAVEHSSVRAAAASFAGPVASADGAGCDAVRVVGVDGVGRIDPRSLLDEVDDRTALVHIQWANHEVATCQPVAEVVAACRTRGVLTHVDATQAVGHVPVDLAPLGADLVSFDGHLLGGPVGVGVLVVRRGLRIAPLVVGGEQERARRAGLENVAGAVGLGAACTELASTSAHEAAEARRLTERVLALADRLPGVPVRGDRVDRVPHIVCLGIDGVEPQAVVLGLDRAGIAVHSGSACASEGLEPSPVLEAMGIDADRSLRISVGWSSTDGDVDALEVALPEVLGDLRALGARH